MIYLILSIFIANSGSGGGVSVSTQQIGPFKLMERCRPLEIALTKPKVVEIGTYTWQTAQCVPAS